MHMCTYMYICIQAYIQHVCAEDDYMYFCVLGCVIYMNICKHVHVKARGQPKLLFLSSHLLLFMRERDSPWDLGFTDQVRLASQ